MYIQMWLGPIAVFYIKKSMNMCVYVCIYVWLCIYVITCKKRMQNCCFFVCSVLPFCFIKYVVTSYFVYFIFRYKFSK